MRGHNTLKSTSFTKSPQLKPYAWKKGQSGNIGGRPKGVASYVKSKTNNIFECIDVLVDVMRGKKLEGLRFSPSVFYRMDAAKYLISLAVPKGSVDDDQTLNDVQRMLFHELIDRVEQNRSGVFQPPTPVDQQVVEAKQLVQDSDQGSGNSTVQT